MQRGKSGRGWRGVCFACKGCGRVWIRSNVGKPNLQLSISEVSGETESCSIHIVLWNPKEKLMEEMVLNKMKNIQLGHVLFHNITSCSSTKIHLWLVTFPPNSQKKELVFLEFDINYVSHSYTSWWIVIWLTQCECLYFYEPIMMNFKLQSADELHNNVLITALVWR